MKKGLTLKTAVMSGLAALSLSFNVLASNPPSAAKETLEVGVYKAVAGQAFKVHFNNKIGGKVTVKIMNLDGDVLYRESVKDAKMYIRKFNMRNFTPGKYMVEISNSDYLTRKIITI